MSVGLLKGIYTFFGFLINITKESLEINVQLDMTLDVTHQPSVILDIVSNRITYIF